MCAFERSEKGMGFKMENVRTYKLKEIKKIKMFSDLEMHKKMFYLMLNRSIDDMERDIEAGNYLTNKEVFGDLL